MKNSPALVKSQAEIDEQKEQEVLLVSPPQAVNNWLPGEHLVSLATAIQGFIRRTDACGWLQQSIDLKCQTKYLTIRVDQRNGNFVVAGDTTPTIRIDHEHWPDHMYPRGWDSQCKMNPMLLKLCLDMNELADHKVTAAQIRAQVDQLDEWLREMVSRHCLEISTKSTISGDQLMRYYGKKPE